jgi:hypothetical protein
MVAEDDMDRAGVDVGERLDDVRERTSCSDDNADNKPAADEKEGDRRFLNTDVDVGTVDKTPAGILASGSIFVSSKVTGAE